MEYQVKNLIIGFGKGGKTLAGKLANQGEPVVIIEKSNQMYGGTCINVGCLPSKKLILQGEQQVPFPEAVHDKNQMTSFLRDKNYHLLADQDLITVIDGKARFLADHLVEVLQPDGSKINYQAERIFINTGSTPFMVPIPGLAASKYRIDSTQAMDLTKAPQHLVIIGGGYIGLEFASMFQHYGSKVTVLDHNNVFIPREDRDVADAVYHDMIAEKIDIKMNVLIKKVNQDIITFEQDGKLHTITADKILVATGRRPNTAELGLENTNIATDQTGSIVVADDLQTTVPSVWALGDVKGGPQFTYISLDDQRIVVDQLFGKKEYKLSDRTLVPYSVFLTPPLSRIGLNEQDAKAQGIEYKLFKLAVAAIPKARVMNETRGIFKILVDPKTDLILGATIYAVESHEVINLITLAMQNNLPYQILRDQIYTHPTMTEALNDVLKD
ncbi:FAD-dependent oxidoreductase [Ligilactobacillus ceti]|uniref:Pyridine nucleotide-disulfide oxidoreductase family protein n=1 Tax=Ligilactobacillus ceti DSM 22408 TaxID=1122146 RepID=A0A0R2KHF9_9LACO|nr:FAD-dependent oxidoreductase [Ligilactobacillus ceti]KRN88816.1 pyridine nucleotide-disulfide oxidoreductase family protein [Ligilactobacillus ceti DSM 22408]